MIRWREPLYLDKQMQNWRKREKIMKAAERRKPCAPEIYGIALAQSDGDQLSLFRLNELLLPIELERSVRIVGLAGGRESAVELAVRMIEETYRSTGDCNVRSYLEF